MSTHEEPLRIAMARRVIAASADRIFELIADPAQQPRWDGNINLADAEPGQRVRAAGEVFTMTLTRGSIRQNCVVEFDEARRIAWRPAEPGQEPPGHLWRRELQPIDATTTRVTHTYDWSHLTDATRLARARATTSDKLEASLARLGCHCRASLNCLPQLARPEPQLPVDAPMECQGMGARSSGASRVGGRCRARGRRSA